MAEFMIFEIKEDHSINIYENVPKRPYSKACQQTASKPCGAGDTLSLYKEKTGYRV